MSEGDFNAPTNQTRDGRTDMPPVPDDGVPRRAVVRHELDQVRSKSEIGARHRQDLTTNDELILHDVFGAITYKSEGTFIYSHGFITEAFLRAHIPDIHKQIYLCGPNPMMTAIEGLLDSLHIDKSLVVKEAV